MTAMRRGLNIAEAISLSSWDMARGKSAKGTVIFVQRSCGGFRVVNGYTDPTVVRKLTAAELKKRDWRAA